MSIAKKTDEVEDEEDEFFFFRDPNEKENQKYLKTTENIYRHTLDGKLYKKGSILRAGYDESVISDKLAPPPVRWVEFQEVPKPEGDDEDDGKGGPLFYRDPDEVQHQKLLKTADPIYRYIEDDKLYKRGSIIRAGYDESAMSDKLAKDHYLPRWIEFRQPPAKK